VTERGVKKKDVEVLEEKVIKTAVKADQITENFYGVSPVK